VPRQLLLGKRQRQGERAEHVAHRLRVVVEDRVEVLLADLDGLGRVDGDDRRQAPRAVEHADLAEDVARAETVQHESRVAAGAHHAQQAARDDVHAVARLALAEDDLARAERAALGTAGELAQRGVRQPGEQLDAGQLRRRDRPRETRGRGVRDRGGGRHGRAVDRVSRDAPGHHGAPRRGPRRSAPSRSP
jgi:hypothetical protein